MDLSIIIINYNTKDLLKQCLQSIKLDDRKLDFEVIVVDNNSNDGSVDIVRRDFPFVRLIINEKNEGFAKANNKGIRESKGKYILLLNSDIIDSANVFETMIKYMDANPDIGMASCKLVKPDGKLDLACRRSFPTPSNSFFRASGLSKIFPKSRVFSKYNLTYLHEDEEIEVDAICGAFMMIRRRALEEVGHMDENFFMYGEDLDWCMRFKQKGWKIYYYPKAEATHYKGASAQKYNREMINEFFKSMKLFYNKHHSSKYHPIINWLSMRGIDLWKFIALFKNMLRIKKKVTP